MKKVISTIKTPILTTLVFICICGLFYPLLMTGLGQAIFPHQANGSQIVADGKVVGSSLIGQDFSGDARFMQGRPSAVNYNMYTESEKADGSYTGVASGSSNLAPSNPELEKRVKADMDAFLASHENVQASDIPMDLLTQSGSGLDPEISPAAADIQLATISKNTQISEDKLQEIVEKHTHGKTIGFLGEETVNVLAVNLDIAEKIGLLN
ncbi:MAG: potassium-transporting ATPase subunit KdpC [Streptococcaceae bacterium]|jgi:K+-transporting ATPase ATPase C chain|nr:potassium-transporting ATPase subunit KdpC [Streptococcaceae bacterium]